VPTVKTDAELFYTPGKPNRGPEYMTSSRPASQRYTKPAKLLENPDAIIIGTGIGVAIISPFGIVKDNRFQASTASVFYSFFALGVATISSPRFDSVNTIARALISGSTLTFPIEDYIESEVTAATYAVNFDITKSDAFVSFRQWITTRIVNLSLAAITDSARRVVRNGAATVVDDTTTTSGSFAPAPSRSMSRFLPSVSALFPSSRWNGTGSRSFGECVNAAADEIRAGGEQVQASAAELSSLAEQLTRLVGQFRV
jgi:hypothetical protein